MPKSTARLNVHQFNVKQTELEYQKLQEINTRLFGGSLNKSDLGRFLIKIALDTLKDAKVESKTTTVIKVNGKVIDT